MTDRKDEPNRKDGQMGSEQAPADGAAGKRPFATIDLKAVEVPGTAAKPAAPGQGEAAARVVAAAAATSQRAGAAGSAGSVPATGARAGEAASAGKPGAAKPAAEASAAGSRAQPGAVPPGPAAAAPAAAAPVRPVAVPRRGSRLGSFVTHTLAGLVGGALAMLGAPHLVPQLAPILADLGIPAPPAPSLPPELAGRLAALERTAARPADPAADPARAMIVAEAARKRIDELATALAAVREAQARTAEQAGAIEARLVKEPPIADAAERLVRLEQQLAALAAAARTEPATAGRIPQLAQLTGRLADIESALATRMATLRRDVLQEVETRIQPSTEASETARSGTQRIDRDVITLKSETNRLASGLDQVKTSADRLQLALKATQDETAGIGSRLDGFRRDVESRFAATAKPDQVRQTVEPLTARIATLESSLTGVVRSETERKATAERIVLSLELGNLKRAMERGSPYAEELAEVKKVAGSRIDLSALEPYRGTGVPTLAELARTFRPVANAILDADRDKGDGGVVDRLLSGAKTFVRVRKTAHAEGDASSEAVVARMEAALRTARLGDVLAEARTLAVKPPAAVEWLARVEARHSVDAALAAIDAALKSSLGAGPAAAPAAAPPAAQKKANP